ncbi:hypothetical protein DFH08DRAFT_1088370 [Mycena albidolilacea]|uniref:DUF6534 domain-containing protein n=1 Tax=Mycena albidolilacea TaxID=1033008 RepID=A0AAD6Z631_9AGAR|nr:hypothetical protein DFH08DRAFT_1088370 [Mycena albidolilacea]
MATAYPPPAVIRRLVVFYLGDWDLAICADLILQGIIFAQIAHYAILYNNDDLALRAYVAVLLKITMLKSAQGLVIMWIQNVEYFMNLNAALSMFTESWTTEINLTLVVLTAFCVQLFFCKRLWTISKNVYIVILVVALFVFALVAAIVSNVFEFAGQSKNFTWSESIRNLGGDLTVYLCGSTIYFLLHHSKHASPDSASKLSSLTKLTFQSAAPAALCALISLASTLAWDRTTPNAYIMLALITNNVLPKLYAISAMWTLNSRRKIRQAHSSTGRNGSAAASGHRHTNRIELTWPWMSGDSSATVRVQTDVEMKQLTEPVESSPKSDRP